MTQVLAHKSPNHVNAVGTSLCFSFNYASYDPSHEIYIQKVPPFT